MNRSRVTRGIALASAIVAIVAIVGLTQATLSLVIDPGLKFLGQWYWNSAASAIVKTRVQNVSSIDAVVLVEVKARAEDGSTVGGSVRLLIPAGTGREATNSLPKRITSLEFTQIRFQPANSGPRPPSSFP